MVFNIPFASAKSKYTAVQDVTLIEILAKLRIQ